MKCKHCGSIDTIKNGGGRIKCSECGKTTLLNPKYKKEVEKELKHELKETRQELKESEKLLQMFTKLDNRKKKAPKWMLPKKGKKKDVSIATAFLSDTHFDEVVNAAEINHVNEYNRKIATKRLKNFFDRTVMLSRDHMNVEIEGLVLALGGDMVSGNIHEELKMSNEAAIMDTVLYWSGQLEAGVRQLAEYFPSLYIPAVTGNHGRNTHKPIHKGRVRDNFDYLIYKLVEKSTHDLTTVEWAVSDSTDARWKVYETRYLMTHGDQFRGGSGISGIATPLHLGAHRKQKREASTGTPFDIMMVGHFHQWRDYGHVIVNGSLKGYDEFAAGCNFDFEKPTQGFWLTHPKHGRTITAPIYC